MTRGTLGRQQGAQHCGLGLRAWTAKASFLSAPAPSWCLMTGFRHSVLCLLSHHCVFAACPVVALVASLVLPRHHLSTQSQLSAAGSHWSRNSNSGDSA